MGIHSFALRSFAHNCSWANRSRRTLQKSNREQIALDFVIDANCSQKTSDLLEKTYLLYVFDSFSQFFPLLSLFTKEQQWMIHSCHSWQKSDRSDSLFFTSESLLCSFAHKKWAIRSKNRRANSQPWYVVMFKWRKCLFCTFVYNWISIIKFNGLKLVS